jgi:hypothetical protein
MSIRGTRKGGTLLSRSSQDGWEVEKLAELSMSHDVVAVDGGIPVPSKLVQSYLKVENEKHGVVLVDALPWDGYEESLSTLRQR